MKKKELEALRKKDSDDLRQQLGELREQLMQTRFQHATGALENPTQLAHLKRDIARILTVLTERESAPVAEPAQAE